MAQVNTARVAWSGKRLDFQGSLGSGYEFVLSGAADKHGGSPMEFLLAGLAGCTAVDVVLMLQKQRQQVSGISVEASGKRAEEHPRVYTEVTLRYLIQGSEIDSKSVERAIRLSEEKYCSASAMFARAGASIRTDYEIVEEQ